MGFVVRLIGVDAVSGGDGWIGVFMNRRTDLAGGGR